jgi:hypothetical protein
MGGRVVSAKEFADTPYPINAFCANCQRQLAWVPGAGRHIVRHMEEPILDCFVSPSVSVPNDAQDEADRAYRDFDRKFAALKSAEAASDE